MNLLPIKGQIDLVRDTDTGAVLHTNLESSRGLKFAKDKRRKEKEQLKKNTTDINSIKSDLTEIKTMITTLIEGKNNGR